MELILHGPFGPCFLMNKLIFTAYLDIHLHFYYLDLSYLVINLFFLFGRLFLFNRRIKHIKSRLTLTNNDYLL